MERERGRVRRNPLSTLLRVGAYAAAALVIAWLATNRNLEGQAGRPSSSGASAQLVDDLVVANKILSNEGILDGLGHISVRHDQNPNHFLLSRDLAPLLVTAADLVEYDLEGAPVGANAPPGYQERFIHAAIYKARPDVKSVVHAHAPSLLTFADSSVPLRPMYHMAAFLAEGVPNYEIRKVEGSTGMLVNSLKLGTALAQTLGDKPLALMRGHGVVVVGPNIPEAVSRAIFADTNAKIQLQAVALGGTISYLSGVDTTPIPPTGQQTTGAPYPRSWPYWKQRAMGQ